MSVFIHSTRNALAVALICCIGIYGQASPAAAKRSRPDPPDLQEMKNYRLSMDKLDRFAAASQSLMILAKSNPAMKTAVQSGTGAKTLDDGAKLMESKYPEAAAAIKKSGMSVREFFLASVTLMTTTMVVGMKKQGQSLSQLPSSISPENLAFVEQNYPKIEKMLNGLSRAGEE